MEKIKILYVITKGNWGGAQRYVYDLATHLPTERFEVKVAYGSGTELAAKLAQVNVPSLSIPTLDRDINLGADWRVFRELVNLFKRERPDVVHLNSAKIGGLGALAARLVGIPKIIFTAHGWTFKEQRSWLATQVIKFLSWLTIVLSHHTIVIAESEKKLVQNWLGVTAKLVQIYNGLEPAKFLSRANAREQLNNKLPLKFSDDNMLIGTIAELHRNKGLGYAVAAMEEVKVTHPNVRLLIIGNGEERANLEREIVTKGVSKYVFLTGAIDRAATLLPAFDIFVLPSIKEGLPYVLLEAGAAGLPTVSTTVGGVPEIVHNNVSGLVVPPRQSKALAKALRQLLDNPDQRQLFGNHLKQQVLEQFSLQNMLEKTTALYAKPITSRSSASR